MAKKAYFSPVLLTSGGIDINKSQEGSIGGGNGAWDDFWYNYADDILTNYPGFDVNDATTWPEWFDINDPDSWGDLV